MSESVAKGQVLMAAESAMEYANSALRGRASNRSENIAHAALRILQTEGKNVELNFQNAEERAFSSLEKAVKDARVNQQFWDADEILKRGYGNCGEHSVLVCDYIAHNFPNITAYFIAIFLPWDHAFVVVGAPAQGVGNSVDISFPDPPAEFGANAYVVDAWYHEVYPVQSGPWTQKLGRTLLTCCHDKTKKLPMAPPGIEAHVWRKS